MNPEAVALFRDLADRSPAEREEYYVRQKVPAAVREEVESLLRYDGDTVDPCPSARRRRGERAARQQPCDRRAFPRGNRCSAKPGRPTVGSCAVS